MATQNQKAQFEKRIREYRKRYLTKKENLKLNEQGTRVLVDHFLTDVLGYTDFEDIKREYVIKSEYADYVIQVARKKHFVVEAKSIQLDLNERHLNQSLAYAANEGIDWILLFNAKQVQLYRVIFSKPIRVHKIFDFDLADLSTISRASDNLINVSKIALQKGELEIYWKRFDALNTNNLIKMMYSKDVVNALRRTLKKNSGMYFNDEEMMSCIEQLILNSNPHIKPKAVK